MTIDIDEKYLIDTLQELVKIDSTNPTLAVENAGEGQIAAALAQRATD